jgi:hypothetical protein
LPLRPSRALDALRRAKLYGTLRDVIVVGIGAGLVCTSVALPLAQQSVLLTGGSALMVAGVVLLIMREIRSYRLGDEP